MLLAAASLLLTQPNTVMAEESAKPIAATVANTQGGFSITVQKNDGEVRTHFIQVIFDSVTNTTTYKRVTSGDVFTDIASSKSGQFVELATLEPGVMVSASTRKTLGKAWDGEAHGTAYDVSTACTSNAGYDDCLTVGLKNKPTVQTAVLQMPTTGAPEGLSRMGLLSMMVLFSGLAVATIRSRRPVIA